MSLPVPILFLGGRIYAMFLFLSSLSNAGKNPSAGKNNRPSSGLPICQDSVQRVERKKKRKKRKRERKKLQKLEIHVSSSAALKVDVVGHGKKVG